MDSDDYKIKGLPKGFADVIYSITEFRRTIFELKALSLFLVGNMGKLFQILKFEVKRTTPLKVASRQTCCFILLIDTYVTLI